MQLKPTDSTRFLHYGINPGSRLLPRETIFYRMPHCYGQCSSSCLLRNYSLKLRVIQKERMISLSVFRKSRHVRTRKLLEQECSLLVHLSSPTSLLSSFRRWFLVACAHLRDDVSLCPFIVVRTHTSRTIYFLLPSSAGVPSSY